MFKWSINAIVIVLSLGLCASSAYAQNAQVVGVVKDASGLVIPGVTVTARNADTGLTRIALSEANGEYRVPSLPPGRYIVTAELSGFSTETRPDIVLIIEQTATITFTLKPAALSETVTVTVFEAMSEAATPACAAAARSAAVNSASSSLLRRTPAATAS